MLFAACCLPRSIVLRCRGLDVKPADGVRIKPHRFRLPAVPREAGVTHSEIPGVKQ